MPAEIATRTDPKPTPTRFRVADEPKRDALPDAIRLDWSHEGLAGVFYTRSLSMGRLAVLAGLTAQRLAHGAA